LLPVSTRPCPFRTEALSPGGGGKLPEQNEIAAMLQTIDRKIHLHERKRTALSETFQTLLHHLMTAQIRVDKLDIDTSEVAA
jgi:type I restriction enzyme S subunit